ncbi:MAG TPA: exosortase/archaeosortase family protein [Candidatus Hypogeohydataceae bacterium YC41]
MKIQERGRVLIDNWPVLIITALLAYTYLDTFKWMIVRWLKADSYYSHGFIIPFISAYLIWKDRSYIQDKGQSDSWGTNLGLVLLTGGAGLHCAGVLFKILFLSGISLVILLLGMVFYIYGSEVGRKLLFPVLFLFAMVPLPLSLIADLSLKLKLFVAGLATWTVSLMGIVALREGSFIHFSNDSIIVGDVCSGLRSIIALLAFGALFAYVSDLSRTMRAVLFLSSVPIALLSNSVRVVAVCLIANQWGSKVATGRVHDLTGILIFIVAFILFFSLEKQLHVLEQALFKTEKDSSE